MELVEAVRVADGSLQEEDGGGVGEYRLGAKGVEKEAGKYTVVGG